MTTSDTTPRPPKKHPKKLRDWKPHFLALIAANGNVSRATKACGIDRSAAYKARETDAAFAQAWDDADKVLCDEMEYELQRRGRTTSDTCLIFWLKAHLPEKYGDRVIHGGMGPGGEIRIRVLYEDQSLNTAPAEAAPEPASGDPECAPV
jgi:hypothetical protein